MAAVVPRVPTEDEEQIALFRWAAMMEWKYPQLRRLYHIPNGGKRTKAEAGIFKAMGVKSGVPDVHLPVARGGYHGLYVEMKRTKGGQVSQDQKDWIEDLTREGYFAVVCRGWEEASRVIEGYLSRD